MPAVPVQTADEPIAIVGLSCRLPGADDADAFWEALVGQVDAIGAVPDARLAAGTFDERHADVPPQVRLGAFSSGSMRSTRPFSAFPRWKPDAWIRSSG